MANLKGSKTEGNLKAAFAGESQANRRYLYFAQKADVEGYNDVAAVFRSTAEGETGHAHGHLEFLEVSGDPATGLPIGPTGSNLKAAIAGETHEYTDMYPGMARTARNEGFEEIADWFETLAKAERYRLLQRQPNYGRGARITGNALGAGFASDTITCTSGVGGASGVSGYTEFFIPSADCRKAMTASGKVTGRMMQNVVEYNMQGMLAKMPAGELRFSLGAGSRDNFYTFANDPLSTPQSVTDQLGGFFPAGDSSGKTTVEEAYGEMLIPLRHWEAGAELVHIEGSRWAWGTTIDQCCTFAAFDRIGNAQNISRVGIVFSEGHDHALGSAKSVWLDAPWMQGLRRLMECHRDIGWRCHDLRHARFEEAPIWAPPVGDDRVW